MSDSKHITDEHIIQTLEAYGCSWRDYILVGSESSELPGVCRYVPGSGLWRLLIEDNKLAFATVDFLMRRDARIFASFEEVKQEFGWDGLAKLKRDK